MTLGYDGLSFDLILKGQVKCHTIVLKGRVAVLKVKRKVRACNQAVLNPLTKRYCNSHQWLTCEPCLNK